MVSAQPSLCTNLKGVNMCQRGSSGCACFDVSNNIDDMCECCRDKCLDNNFGVTPSGEEYESPEEVARRVRMFCASH